MADKPVIYADASSLNKIGKELEGFPQSVDRVVARVLYRTRDFAKSEIIRQIPKIYDTTPAEIKSALHKDRKRYVIIRQAEGAVNLEVTGNPINLARFHHFPKIPVYGKRAKRVFSQVQVMKETGMKTLRPRKGADGKAKNIFLAPTGANGKVKKDGTPKVQFIFFSRTGEAAKRDPSREAIEPIYSLSIPQMITNPKIKQALSVAISEKMEKEVEHQLNYELTRLAGVMNKSGGG